MFNIARKIAGKSEHKQHHHACIITKGGKIIATGYNHKYMHAEEDALRKIDTLELRNNRLIVGMVLYSFRWRKNGTWGMAHPCEECMKLMHRFDAVYYTNEEGVLTKL